MADFSPGVNSEKFSEAAIFGRVVEQSGTITPELAEHMLSLNISDSDQQRIQELIEKNSEGELSGLEREELFNFNHVADLISLWHSRARRILNPC